MLNNERSAIDRKGSRYSRIDPLGAAVVSTLLFLFAGCSSIPKEQIAAFTSSYAQVDVAGRAVYVAYESAVGRPFGVRPPATSNRFTAIYLDTISERFRSPSKAAIGDDLSARYAAMDAMLVFNNGLAGIVEGRGVAEIKAAVAPLQLIVGTVGGPAGVSLAAITDFVANGVVAAESRADLVKALTAEMEPIVISVGEKDQVYQGHPAVVLLKALEDDANDMTASVLGRLATRIDKLDERFGESPESSEGKLAYAAAYDDGEGLLQAISEYRELLGVTQVYFSQLRRAALGQSAIVQTTEFVRTVQEMGAQALAIQRSL